MQDNKKLIFAAVFLILLCIGASLFYQHRKAQLGLSYVEAYSVTSIYCVK